jgi:hypothetical protein
MSEPTIIRCSIPDCDWGFEASDFSRMDRCYRAYSLQCIEMHGADRDSHIYFDLEKVMLSLKK